MSRVTRHAKVVSTPFGDLVAFLQRDADDRLCVIMQLWCDETDEPLRAKVSFEHDEENAQRMLEELNGETAPDMMEECGMIQVLKDIQAGLT